MKAAAEAHYKAMDAMGNENGLLEVRPATFCAPALSRAADPAAAPQVDEWMAKVMETGKELKDHEFEESMKAWTELIDHKKAREEKSAKG